jgi:hypothetical protein
MFSGLVVWHDPEDRNFCNWDLDYLNVKDLN